MHTRIRNIQSLGKEHPFLIKLIDRRATRVWGLHYPYICIYIYIHTHTYMQALQNKSKNIIFKNRLRVQLWVDIDSVQASQKKNNVVLRAPYKPSLQYSYETIPPKPYTIKTLA